MANRSFPLAQNAVRNSLVLDPISLTLFFATTDGEVRFFGLPRENGGLLADGFGEIRGLTESPGGFGIIVAEAGGKITLVGRRGWDHGDAIEVADLGEPLVAVALHAAAKRLLILTEAGVLLALEPSSGATAVLQSGFAAPRALAITSDPARAWVLEATGDGGTERRLSGFDLDTVESIGPKTLPLASDVLCGFALTGETGLLLVDPANGTTSCFDPATETIVDGALAEPGVVGVAHWRSVVLTAGPTGLLARDWRLADTGAALGLPLAPAYAGGFQRGSIDIAALGLDRGEIVLDVDEPPEVGYIAPGIEPGAEDGRLDFVFCAGLIAGEAHVRATRRSDGATIGRARIQIVGYWPDDALGPPIVATGRYASYPVGSWGGGPLAPENLRTKPAPHVWRVLFALVDVRDSAFSAAEAAGEAPRWDTILAETAAIFEEASRYSPGPQSPRGTTVEPVLRAAASNLVGPITVDLRWADAFKYRKPGSSDFFAGWLDKAGFVDACVDALCTHLDDARTGSHILPLTDTVVFVVRTASDGAVALDGKLQGALYSWAYARVSTRFWWKTRHADGSTTFTTAPHKERGVVVMPNRFPNLMPAERQFDFTNCLAHEIGHTLRLPDLYDRDGVFSDAIAGRVVGAVDIMGTTERANFSLGNRMQLGWIEPNWIQTFNFANAPVGGAVVLQAAGSVPPGGLPPGRRAGIEVRIRHGWNYYFEYRRAAPGLLLDQAMATTLGGGELVLGTEMAGERSPQILRLAADADGDGPILSTAGDDYAETDTSNPERQHDFRLIFDGVDPVDPDAARVRVEYVRAHRADLSIAPAPGHGDWKSPDIDLEGPGGANRVVKGRQHKIVARVRNLGTRAANAVVVRFSWLPFTVSPGTWTELGSAPPANIPARQTVAFTMDWTPPAGLRIGDLEVEHFCVRVAIDRYVDPVDPDGSEIVLYNNAAQSNFDTQELAHGSPSERRWTGLVVDNPTPVAATYFLRPEQSSEHLRLFLGHAWLRLEPDGRAMVPFAAETLAQDVVHGAAFDRAFREGAFERPPIASVMAYILPEALTQCPTPAPVWGVGLALRPGWRTRIARLYRDGRVVMAEVERAENGIWTPVASGSLAMVFWFDDEPDRQETIEAEALSNGHFRGILTRAIFSRLDEVPLWCEAIYAGAAVLSAARSGDVML